MMISSSLTGFPFVWFVAEQHLFFFVFFPWLSYQVTLIHLDTWWPTLGRWGKRLKSFFCPVLKRQSLGKAHSPFAEGWVYLPPRMKSSLAIQSGEGWPNLLNCVTFLLLCRKTGQVSRLVFQRVISVRGSEGLVVIHAASLPPTASGLGTERWFVLSSASFPISLAAQQESTA